MLATADMPGSRYFGVRGVRRLRRGISSYFAELVSGLLPRNTSWNRSLYIWLLKEHTTASPTQRYQPHVLSVMELPRYFLGLSRALYVIEG